MMGKNLARLTPVLALSMLASAANASLVNPSFEDPQIAEGETEYFGATGWTTFGNFGGPFTVADSTLPVSAHDGSQVLKAFGTSGAYQEFSVNADDLVTATAWALNNSEDSLSGAQVAGVNIEWFNSVDVCTPDGGGGCIVSFGSTIDASTTQDVWTQIGVLGAAVPTDATLARVVLITGAFTGGGGGAAFFDDASFSTAVVPVPAAVWLFGSGLLGLIGVARRRKS